MDELTQALSLRNFTYSIPILSEPLRLGKLTRHLPAEIRENRRDREVGELPGGRGIDGVANQAIAPLSSGLKKTLRKLSVSSRKARNLVLL
jgi:hypothetical protein